MIDYSKMGLTWIPYAVAAFYLFQFGKFVYDYVMSLRVEAKPNEWVIIMRAGEQVSAGIGLSCFRGPFDQVAIFPSQIVKVEVRTQQVTQEMQGIEVSSMIEW